MKLSDFNVVETKIKEIKLCQMFLKPDTEYKDEKETNEDRKSIEEYYRKKIKALYKDLEDMGVEVDINVNRLR